MQSAVKRRVGGYLLALVAAGLMAATPSLGAPFGAPLSGPQKADDSTAEKAAVKPEKRITPAQAKELFRSVDEILKFASNDTKLPIKSQVKRRLTTRDAVSKYVVEKFKDDEDAKRMQRSEIVLKKFGLLDRDFQLGPFLVSLLTEQIAGYYDDKAKTVNLLDWIEPDAQKSVLAHELTHALQDQHVVGLEKWGNKSETDVARNVAEDNRHLATDEADTARDAVLEGQAMAVFVDYELKPTGRTLLTAPDMVANLMDNMEDSSDSPVMARAPLLLQQSLLFPYREGLVFEQSLWKDSDTKGAFAGALDRPPATSYEILNPAAYERKQKVPLLTLPDIHDAIADYEPYDVGVMGALDVRMLVELFAGQPASQALTPEWDGGLYYAAQKKSARTVAEKSSTASLGLLYLSRWKTPEAAEKFAGIYADELGQKYSGVSRDQDAAADESERIFKTNEGPVLIVVSGKQVFVSESFDLATARKLELLLVGAQDGEGLQSAAIRKPVGPPVKAATYASGELTGGMVRWLSSCGLMKVALPR